MAHLDVAFSLLGPRPWEKRYAVALEMRLAYAESACAARDQPAMRAAVGDVLAHATSLVDQIPAHRVRILALESQNEMVEAVKTAVSTLALLGVHVPVQPSRARILVELGLTRWRLLGKDVGALVGL